MEQFDIAIIGGGPSGLYCADRAHEIDPSKKVVVFETNPKVGGRAQYIDWKGHLIPNGAGRVRLDTDIFLPKVLAKYGATIEEEVFNTMAVNPKIDLNDCYKKLRHSLKFLKDRSSWKAADWIRKCLGPYYDDFIVAFGHTDFINSDVVDVIEEYGLEDLSNGSRMGITNWSDTWNKIAKQYDVRLNSSARIHEVAEGGGYILQINGKEYCYAKCVVVATNIQRAKNVIKLVVSEEALKQYQGIRGQPFIRLYIQVDKEKSALFMEKVKDMTYVKGPIQRIWPITEGIYAYYADNVCAQELLQHWEDLNWLEQETETVLMLPENSISIIDSKVIYWNCGTHYYTPLSKEYKDRDQFLDFIQNPIPGVFVIGEMVSRHAQGWIEGALHSTEQILPKLMSSL